MKKLIIVTLLMVASTVGAVTFFGSVDKYTKTKGFLEVPVERSALIQTTSSSCFMYATTSGNGFPLKVNTMYEFNFPGNQTSVNFRCNSSAAARPATIYVAK
jgi:hypothetical protein